VTQRPGSGMEVPAVKMSVKMSADAEADDPAEADLLAQARREVPRELLERADAPLIVRMRHSASRPGACSLDVSMDGTFAAAIELHRRARAAARTCHSYAPARFDRGARAYRQCAERGVRPAPNLRRPVRRRAHARRHRLARGDAPLQRPDGPRRVRSPPSPTRPPAIGRNYPRPSTSPRPLRSSLLVYLDELPARLRLVRLVRWLGSLDGLFSAPCAHCGALLAAAGASQTQLLPPTIRPAEGRPFHEARDA
jgi:hypothetical protein